eukprot:scaffold75792_cov65-Phaeocystis_antarctica.AAC.6
MRGWPPGQELPLHMPCSGNGDGLRAMGDRLLNDKCLGSTGEGSGSVVGSEACSAGGRPCAVGSGTGSASDGPRSAGTLTLRRLLISTLRRIERGDRRSSHESRANESCIVYMYSMTRPPRAINVAPQFRPRSDAIADYAAWVQT